MCRWLGLPDIYWLLIYRYLPEASVRFGVLCRICKTWQDATCRHFPIPTLATSQSSRRHSHLKYQFPNDAICQQRMRVLHHARLANPQVYGTLHDVWAAEKRSQALVTRLTVEIQETADATMYQSEGTLSLITLFSGFLSLVELDLALPRCFFVDSYVDSRPYALPFNLHTLRRLTFSSDSTNRPDYDYQSGRYYTCTWRVDENLTNSLELLCLFHPGIKLQCFGDVEFARLETLHLICMAQLEECCCRRKRMGELAHPITHILWLPALKQLTCQMTDRLYTRWMHLPALSFLELSLSTAGQSEIEHWADEVISASNLHHLVLNGFGADIQLFFNVSKLGRTLTHLELVGETDSDGKNRYSSTRYNNDKERMERLVMDCTQFSLLRRLDLYCILDPIFKDLICLRELRRLRMILSLPHAMSTPLDLYTAVTCLPHLYELDLYGTGIRLVEKGVSDDATLQHHLTTTTTTTTPITLTALTKLTLDLQDDTRRTTRACLDRLQICPNLVTLVLYDAVPAITHTYPKLREFELFLSWPHPLQPQPSDLNIFLKAHPWMEEMHIGAHNVDQTLLWASTCCVALERLRRVTLSHVTKEHIASYSRRLPRSLIFLQ